jgi:fatty-acid peroxygenase
MALSLLSKGREGLMNIQPKTKKIDSTLSLIRDPYQFITATAQNLEADVFETRLLLEKTICMTGANAARLFTDESLFTRKGAAPELVRATLLGKDGIQTLDGEAHLHRKMLFMSINDPGSLYHLRSLVNDWLDIYTASWQEKDEISLDEEFQEILTRSVCSWAGLELPEEDVKERTQELALMFDAAGSLKKHLFSRKGKPNAGSWICGIVNDLRDGKQVVPDGSPVYQFAFFKDEKGEYLSPKVAAVEILNLIRPTVALSLYLVFCCHALHMHPEHKQRIKAQEIGQLDRFVNEIRRYYPFFPALFAKVRKNFEWNGFNFERGTRVLLDVYGTNHDPRDWHEPFKFNPDRFKDWHGNPYSFIPQGVGDHYNDHRCPGELLAIELMRSVVEYFVNRIYYTVPKQNLVIDMSRLPAAPKSHFKISHVRRIHLYPEHFV